MARTNILQDPAVAEKAILEYLRREDYRPLPLRELMHRLHVPGDVRPSVRRVVKGLIQDGKIARVRGNRLAASTAGQTIRGRLERHRYGFGFVVPEDGGRDVFVPPRAMGEALHGDIVAVRITGRGREGKLEGSIVEILDRRSRRLLGLFRSHQRGGEVDPFDPVVSVPIHVPGAFASGARDGDAVTVELMSASVGDGRPTGKVVEVLGPVDAPGVDTLIVARRHGLAMEFPEEALRAAAALPQAVPPAEARRRERFEDPAPVTIDGETARDFDDAIAVAELPRGGFRLWVHIADVAAFVPTGSPLDREARARGTSVYFPDRVLPMFPEALSNDLCSLRPGEDRLVQSAILDLDAAARVRSVRFADGVIRSAARLTYTQVAAVLDGTKRVAGVPAAVVPMLQVADRLRDLLERRRRARGSVDFDLPEPRILLDVEGAMTGITIEPRNRAHRMIEEFMLAANEAVAGFLERKEAPCLYRIHEAPDPLKVEALQTFVAGFGLEMPVDPMHVSPADIQRLMDLAEGRTEYPVIAQVALRAMRQARYSEENVGHFGLAAEVYCHFTSPIRRYPDLMVHRLLRGVRAGTPDAVARDAEDLRTLGELCSRLERVAETAEREVLDWKKIVFIRGREGESFDGIVTGVAPFGLFVQLTENLVEGLLRTETLGDDEWDHIEGRQEIRGRRTGASFRLGQRLRVVVRRVDVVLRRVDLGLDRAGAGAVAEQPTPRRRRATQRTAVAEPRTRKRSTSGAKGARTGSRATGARGRGRRAR